MEICRIISQVPEGMVTTYGEVAKALGDPIAAMFVALVTSEDIDTLKVPCHRVVRLDGRLGGRTCEKSLSNKARLLRSEGISVRSGRVTNMDGHLFVDFRSSSPLKTLRERQKTLRRRVRIPLVDKDFEKIAGADISYSSKQAFAAVIVLDTTTGKVTEKLQAVSRADFPYVPTYLAFRELPVLAPLADQLDEETILMYDGNGILHPERFGVASHAGVAFGIPTIGVAKRLLCGRIGDYSKKGEAEVMVNEEVIGHALGGAGQSPIYVSPGHAISVRQSLSTVRTFSKHRVPEPIRIAHLLANDARRSAINK